MKAIKKPWIKLAEMVGKEEYDDINNLQDLCIGIDTTALKLELDYKMGIVPEAGRKASAVEINEFMYYDGDEMIGYAGIGSFGGKGTPIEINGMVHPEYRRQGIFTVLIEMIISEWKKRNSGDILLLCDRHSLSGQEFIKKTGASYKHSEYEMYLREEDPECLKMKRAGIVLRKASNSDAHEIARQNAIYFDEDSEAGELEEEGIVLPEEEERRGMKIYIAEMDGKVVGKVNTQLFSGIGGIYGLGVLPHLRGKGFGREILMMAIEKLKEENADEIMLQVESKNSNALNLYKSCGFKETSIMDYYEIKLWKME